MANRDAFLASARQIARRDDQATGSAFPAPVYFKDQQCPMAVSTCPGQRVPIFGGLPNGPTPGIRRTKMWQTCSSQARCESLIPKLLSISHLLSQIPYMFSSVAEKASLFRGVKCLTSIVLMSTADHSRHMTVKSKMVCFAVIQMKNGNLEN